MTTMKYFTKIGVLPWKEINTYKIGLLSGGQWENTKCWKDDDSHYNESLAVCNWENFESMFIS